MNEKEKRKILKKHLDKWLKKGSTKDYFKKLSELEYLVDYFSMMYGLTLDIKIKPKTLIRGRNLGSVEHSEELIH